MSSENIACIDEKCSGHCGPYPKDFRKTGPGETSTLTHKSACIVCLKKVEVNCTPNPPEKD